MRTIPSCLLAVTLFAFAASGCDTLTDTPLESSKTDALLSKKGNAAPAAVVACQPTSAQDTTALYVNQSVANATIDLGAAGCTVAIYFDADAPKNASVRNVTVLQTLGTNAGGSAVFNKGANVTVSRSTFVTNVGGQFVPIRYQNGATGTISDNELTGTHRVGILVRGEGTDVQVRGNTITGSGAKTSGWAENGIQVDKGGSASVKNNTLEGHWWDGNSNFGSTALLIAGAAAADVANNEFVDNEFSIYAVGDGYKFSGNRTASEIVSQSTLAFQAYGLLLAGSNNHIAGNRFTAENGAAGLYIFAGSSSNRVTGNRFEGFGTPVVDAGTDTMLRGRPLAFGN